MENTIENAAEEGTKVDSPTLTLSAEQYLEIKALFTACGDDRGRETLHHVYFQASQDRFLACDGHVARIHRIIWNDDASGSNPKPKTDFTLRREDFLLNKGQVKVKPFQVIPTYPLDDSEKGILNTLSGLLEPPADYFPQHIIGFDPEVLLQFCKTFQELPNALIFRFSRQNIQATFIYGRLKDNRDGEFELLGVAMPVRILGDQFPKIDWQPVPSEQYCQPRQAA